MLESGYFEIAWTRGYVWTKQLNVKREGRGGSMEDFEEMLCCVEL